MNRRTVLAAVAIFSAFVFGSMAARASVGRAQFPPSSYLGRPHGKVPAQTGALRTETAATDVLIVRNVLPWGSNADEVVLTGIGLGYTIVDTAGFDALTPSALQGYGKVLVPSDQDQAFYDWYALNVARFTQYVQNGGNLVFFAACEGWNEGNLTALLPGGLSYLSPANGGDFSSNDYIVAWADPIVTDALSEHIPLTDPDMWGTSANHGWFDELTLPAGTTVIFRESDFGGHPVAMRYTLGGGTVIATCNTWEYGYYNNSGNFTGKALDDVFLSATPPFTSSFMDDYGRAQFCVNFKTGNYMWSILSGPGAGSSFTGVGKVLNGNQKVVSFPGAPDALNFTFDRLRKKAQGYFLSSQGFYSPFFDRNTADDPPGCSPPRPSVPNLQ